jgi:hypothetical protein
MDVITDPEVDAVWICSPSQFHAEQIKAAAANGKHVFCEKPIATDLGETVEAINACNEAGVKLMIGLQRRFDENFKRVRTAIEKKEVGETIMVSSLFAFILVYQLFVLLFDEFSDAAICWILDQVVLPRSFSTTLRLREGRRWHLRRHGRP